ncbi:adenylyl-sulfate kinase [Pseudoduganella sp. RAF53_2]|uniref:adenylyl-sulfate kinase n=1 Tax=unclassified Pseudoduganella TaxID=2637179 RepID=UPI003F94F743
MSILIDMNNKHIVWQHGAVSRRQREELNGHRAAVVWFTGLSGSGKTTLALAVEEQLTKAGCRAFVLDGDNLRHGLCADLGFSPEARTENVRRAAETARLFVDAGMIVLAAFISPFASDRARARALMLPGDFIETWCRCSAAVCEQRDVKGLYRKARTGEIAHFTGISSPYEEPQKPELVLDTDHLGADAATRQVLIALRQKGVINARHYA